MQIHWDLPYRKQFLIDTIKLFYDSYNYKELQIDLSNITIYLRKYNDVKTYSLDESLDGDLKAILKNEPYISTTKLINNLITNIE